MNKHNQNGAISTSLIVAVLMTLLFVASAGFGYWAFSGRQDYKNNAQEKIDVAVTNAEEKTAEEKEAEFAEREKSPVKAFKAAETFGSLTFNYPRTWSAYVVSGTGSTPVDATFHPDFVSNSKDVAFALRLEVLNTAYDQVVKTYDAKIKAGTVTSAPFVPSLVPSALGLRISGEVEGKKTGVGVILPLRDKTIKIWTESNDYAGDFENFILSSLNFQP